MKRTSLLLFFLFCLSGVSFAQEVGYLLLDWGSVKVTSGNKSKLYLEPNVKIPLNAKDEVHSSNNARGCIYLRGESEMIEVYAATLVKLADYSAAQTGLDMPVGKGRFVVAPKKGPARFQVRTANALIGVKGTDFMVQSQGANTLVLTLDGTVALSSLSEPGKVVELTKDLISSVNKSAAPTPPVKVNQTTKDSLLKKDGATAVDLGALDAAKVLNLSDSAKMPVELNQFAPSSNNSNKIKFTITN